MLTCSSSPVCCRPFLPPTWPARLVTPRPAATGMCVVTFCALPPGTGAGSAPVTSTEAWLGPVAFATRTTAVVPLPSSCDHDA